ncbi:transient receptor potential cation channel subfamily M member 8-like [Ptychodera flava]|uniref:transient receptor potential cation channel subfamily M member 8-like n=1 Tax=Ptychodera flava TaxID=63121 RepID=UPI00396A4F8F
MFRIKIQVYYPNVSLETVENDVREAITKARIESDLYRGKSDISACTLRMVVTLKDVISKMSKRSERKAKKKEFQETLRMIEALRNEEMEFLEKRFNLQKYLDQIILDNDLYKMDKDNGDDDEDWPHPLDEKLKKIIDTYYKPQYKKTIARTSSQNINMPGDANQNGPSYRDLFLWAIQTKRFDLADFAFKKLTDPIMTSLVVSYALKTVAEKLPQREHMKKEEYSALSREYEVKGEKIVSIAYSQSRLDANGLLRDPHKDWRKFTCLDMAIKAKAKIFLSNDCCQDTLRKMWFGKINHKEGSVKVYTVIPFYWAIANTEWIQIGNTKITETSASARGQGCMNYFSNCKAFYSAPVTKFGMHTVSYAMFLMLYAYVMIFCPLGDHFDLTDILLHVWILTIFMEITRQMFSLYRHGHAFRRVDHFLEWKSTSRNKLSMITIVTLIAAFCCRWFDKSVLVSRFLYGVNYFLFTIRALRLYTGSKTLGPMVSMIKHMFFRTLEFMAVFIIFVIGYGVAVQGFLARHSGESLSFGVFVDVFYRPYFQTFGELFIEDLPGAADDDVDPRTAITIMYTILLAIYLFLGNVLLLNLLIAIFSRDVERVQAESLELWKFESYVLHQEFARKPILPPPLSPIVYLYWLIKYIFRKCRKCCCKNKVSPVKKQQSERLRRFHKACLKHYLSNEKDKLHNSIDARTKRLETASKELRVQNEKIVEKASKIGDSTIGIGNRTRRIKKRAANIKEDTAQLVIRQEDVAGKMQSLEQHIEEWESDGRKISALVERQQDDVGELKNRLIDDYFATLSPRIEEMNQMLVSINKRFQDDSNNDSDTQNGNDSLSQVHPDATGDDGSAIKEIQESLNVVHSFLQRIEQSLENRAPRRHLSGADSGLAESQSFSSNLYENIAEDPSNRPQSETPDGKSLLDSGYHGHVEDAPHVTRMETPDDKSPINGDRHVDIPDGMRSESPDDKSKINSSNLVSLVVEDAEPRTSTPIKGRAMTRRRLEDDFTRVANNATTNDPENHDRDNHGRAVAGDKMTPNSDVISNPVVETARSVTKRQHGGDNRNEQKKQRQKLYRRDSSSSSSSDSEELSRQRNSKRRPRPAIRKRETNRNLDTVDITPALRQRMKSSPILASIHYYWGIGPSGNIEMIGRVKSAPRMNQFSEHYSKY